MAQRISQFFEQFVKGIYFPELRFTDILEILIITFLIYQIMVWIKNTKAWMLMRGILALAGFILVAAILQMHTILWLAKEAAAVMKLTAADLYEKGIIEQVIPEPENLTPESMWQVTEELDNRIDDFLKKYDSLSEEELLEHRYTRFRRF